MSIDDHYVGREHSWVKHQLLERYLEILLSIIVASGTARSIAYVDCFSGPWGDASEDLGGTSIAISLRLIERVRTDMRLRAGSKGVTFKAIYVEKDPRSFRRLEDFLKREAPRDIACYALPGDYFNQQSSILELCRGSFAFFFVDPKGWRDVGIPRLRQLLARPHSEFLINFMYDFFNRAIGMEKLRPKVEELIGQISDGDLETLARLAPKERGDFLVGRYRTALKGAMGGSGRARPRSFHAEVLNRAKERLHYHLVYLTRHPKGILKFAEASQTASFLQSLSRFEAKDHQSEQRGLFSPEEQAELGSKSTGTRTIDSEVLSRIGREPTVCDEAFLADLLEETGWFIQDVEAAVARLIQGGKLRNLDAARLRPKHPVHWKKAERLVAVPGYQNALDV